MGPVQNQNSSLTLIQKGAIITALKWIEQWLNNSEEYSPSIALIKTAKLLDFDLNNPIQAKFDEDEHLLTRELQTLNEFQKTWFVTEMHITASAKGEIPPNVMQVLLMIFEGMGISAEKYIDIIKFAGDLQGFNDSMIAPLN
jgi:hypothetical protein